MPAVGWLWPKDDDDDETPFRPLFGEYSLRCQPLLSTSAPTWHGIHLWIKIENILVVDLLDDVDVIEGIDHHQRESKKLQLEAEPFSAK